MYYTLYNTQLYIENLYTIYSQFPALGLWTSAFHSGSQAASETVHVKSLFAGLWCCNWNSCTTSGEPRAWLLLTLLWCPRVVGSPIESSAGLFKTHFSKIFLVPLVAFIWLVSGPNNTFASLPYSRHILLFPLWKMGCNPITTWELAPLTILYWNLLLNGHKIGLNWSYKKQNVNLCMEGTFGPEL